jgi:hypothetical protein
MLKRDQLAAAVVAAIAADPDWLNKHIRPTYSNHLWELGSMTSDRARWRLVRREKVATFGPESWIHQMRLALPDGLAPAMVNGTTALVYERRGAIERVEFWP